MIGTLYGVEILQFFLEWDGLFVRIFELEMYVLVKMRHGFKAKVTFTLFFRLNKEAESRIALRPGHVNKKVNNCVFCTVQSVAL